MVQSKGEDILLYFVNTKPIIHSIDLLNIIYRKPILQIGNFKHTK